MKTTLLIIAALFLSGCTSRAESFRAAVKELVEDCHGDVQVTLEASTYNTTIVVHCTSVGKDRLSRSTVQP